MKKRLIAIAACVVVGAVVNVAVAWGLSWWKGDLKSAHNVALHKITPPRWPTEVPSVWPAEPSNSARRESFGVTVYGGIGGLTYEGERLGSAMRRWIKVGWPMRAMQWLDWDTIGASPVLEGEYLIHDSTMWRGLRIHSVVTRPTTGILSDTNKVLPLMPRWPGFLLNTLFYALVAGAIWFVPIGVRRRIRRARGRCVRCGYELEGKSVCSECGSGND